MRRTAPARHPPPCEIRPRPTYGALPATPADLLAVTAERLRHALWRSFLRYGIPGDLASAVHAAMNVIEPVLQARDTEIERLIRLVPVKAAAGKTTGRTFPTPVRTLSL
jgi:hypothetical protein